jgi:hypothetical protein
MRITQFRSKAHAGARVFTSPKCASAIPVRDLLVRDAVVQATLDPAVRTIERVPLAGLADPSLAVNAVIIERDGQRLLLDVRKTEGKKPRTVDDEGALLVALEELGLTLVELDPVEIRREPRFTNCREVWRYHYHPVPLNDRLQIMHVLAEEGPRSIMELARSISPTVDVVASVCSLACSDILELELGEKPLGPRTMVRERR